MTKPGLPTKTRVPGHKPSSLPRVDRNRARVFPGAVADTGPGTQAWSSLSFLSITREGKGLARCVAFATSESGALRRRGRRLHTANVVFVCLCVRHRHSWIAARAPRSGGPGEVPRPFIHPVWMCDAVWGQTVRSTGQTGVHRARWAGQTSLGSAHRTYRGASQCPKVTGTH
jgi:hypothetical protein